MFHNRLYPRKSTLVGLLCIVASATCHAEEQSASGTVAQAPARDAMKLETDAGYNLSWFWRHGFLVEVDRSGTFEGIDVNVEILESVHPETLLMVQVAPDAGDRVGVPFIELHESLPVTRRADEPTTIKLPQPIQVIKGDKLWVILSSPAGAPINWRRDGNATTRHYYVDQHGRLGGEVNEYYEDSEAPAFALQITPRPLTGGTRSPL